MQNKSEDVVLWMQKSIGFAAVVIVCLEEVNLMHVLKCLVVVCYKDWCVVCIREVAVLCPNDRNATGLIC